LGRPTAERPKRCRSTLCSWYTSGSRSVTRVTRSSRATASRTGIPPEPAPTWKRWAMGYSRPFVAGRARLSAVLRVEDDLTLRAAEQHLRRVQNVPPQDAL